MFVVLVALFIFWLGMWYWYRQYILLLEIKHPNKFDDKWGNSFFNPIVLSRRLKEAKALKNDELIDS
jgi:hypothetical protein